jgi:colanic acid/amylovoran biosynthesis glycosyltransferase
MRLLIILTAAFPYDNGEEFLSAEVNQINGFDRILVCPCNLKADSVVTKKLPKMADCVPLKRTEAGKSVYAELMVQPYMLSEVGSLLQTGRFTFSRLHEMLFFMKNAHEIYHSLLQLEELGSMKLNLTDEVTIYSYWFYDAAAAGTLLAAQLKKRGIKVTQISRAHGFDIHEERAKDSYLPMRRFLLSRVDMLFPCSQNGAQTILRKYPRYAGKIHPAFLGTADHGVKKGSREHGLHILSCSYMVPVKRLHLIAEALRQADFPVCWTHIGSGPLEAEIKSLASELPSQVRTEFMGQMDNETIMDYYKTNDISVFVNVSSSEGIPVSVMEACSFGIPVIATNVGGTGEAVSDGKNGFLIPADFSSDELLNKLNQLKTMSDEEFDCLCVHSREIWVEKFNAVQNFRKFYEEISQ